MKLNDITRQIVLVSGKICSGKGHYCATRFPEYKQITVSDVVRSIANVASRSELSKTIALDQQIADKLIEEISKYQLVIVDGIRQLSILKRLQQHFGSQIEDIIWLDVPEETLRQRFAGRQHNKDDMSFDDSLNKDQEMGLGDVEQYMRSSGRTVNFN